MGSRRLHHAKWPTTNAYHLQGHPSSNFFISSADSLWSGNPPFNGAAELSTSKHKEASKSHPEFLLPLAVRKFQIVDDKSGKCSKIKGQKGMTNDPTRAVADMMVSRPRCRKWAACSLTEQTEVLPHKVLFMLFGDYHKHPPSKGLRGPTIFVSVFANAEPGLSAFLINRLVMSHQLSPSLSDSLQCRQYCQCRALLYNNLAKIILFEFLLLSEAAPPQKYCSGWSNNLECKPLCLMKDAG